MKYDHLAPAVHCSDILATLPNSLSVTIFRVYIFWIDVNSAAMTDEEDLL